MGAARTWVRLCRSCRTQPEDAVRGAQVLFPIHGPCEHDLEQYLPEDWLPTGLRLGSSCISDLKCCKQSVGGGSRWLMNRDVTFQEVLTTPPGALRISSLDRATIPRT